MICPFCKGTLVRAVDALECKSCDTRFEGDILKVTQRHLNDSVLLFELGSRKNKIKRKIANGN